jgi:hypothetical protein
MLINPSAGAAGAATVATAARPAGARRSRSSMASMIKPPTPLAQPMNPGTLGSPAPATAGAESSVVPPVPSSGSVPATGQGTFDSVNNSIGAVINPTASSRLAATSATTDNALKALSSVPDQLSIAQQKFNTYASATDPAFQKSITDATKAAAANGAVGSGMLNTSYGNLALQRSKDLTNERDSIFQDASSKQTQDLLNTLAATRGTEAQVNSQDSANRGEQRTERDYQANRGDTALAQLMQQMQLQDSLKSSGSSRAISEAQAQDNLTNSAYGRTTGAAQVDDALTNSKFQRALQQAQFGYSNDPSLAQLTAADQAGKQASTAYGDVGEIMKMLAANKARLPVAA